MLLYNKNIQESSTLKINTIANKKKNLGETVYNFSVGEPVIDNSKIILDNVCGILKQNRAKYPPPVGVNELVDLAKEWFNNNFNCHYNNKEVMITCGGKYAISLSLQAVLDHNDEVIIISPYWVSYPEMIKIFGGQPKVLITSEEDSWYLDVSKLEKIINSKTKAIIINNGSNPTGHLFAQEELEKILECAHKHNLYIISDEVYSGLTFDDNVFISSGLYEKYKEKLIIVQSCSKNFGMTGWRVGMIFSSQEIIKCLTVLQSQSITNTSIVSQWAAIEAIRHAEGITEDIRKTIQKRRDVFVETFNELFPVKIKPPQSTLYAFVKVSNLGVVNKKSDDFAEDLIDRANVAVTPGKDFGDDNYIRFSFGVSEDEIKKGLNVLKKFVDNYNQHLSCE